MAQTLSYLTIKTKQILFCSLKKGFRFDMINANFWTKTRKYDYNVFIKLTLLFIRLSQFNNAEYLNIIVRFDTTNSMKKIKNHCITQLLCNRCNSVLWF